MLIEFTGPFLKAVKCPEGVKRIEYCDRDLESRGLYLEVLRDRPGAGNWRWRTKVAGKTTHFPIGRFPHMSLKEARDAAKRLRAERLLDRERIDNKSEAPAVPTLSGYFADTYLPAKKLYKRSWWRDVQLFKLRIEPVFGSRRMDAVGRHELREFHQKLVQEPMAPSSANAHLRLLKHMYYDAISRQIITCANPVARLPMLPENNQRDRYLLDDELERLMLVLRTDANRRVCQVAMVLIATGCRLSEILLLKWADVDVERRMIVIQSPNSKSKKRRSVPLNDSAIEVLQGLDTKDQFEYVFANPKTGKPLTRFGHTWRRLAKKSGVAWLRIHDLRHAYASFLVQAGRSLFEVQQILGHSSPIVTQRYAHLSTKALQEAASAASAKLTSAGARTAA